MATVMPTLPIVRELISYVPTTKNVATRGHLIGIPYLGDKFNADDQRLINSISIEPSKQQKLIRSIIQFFSLLINHCFSLEKKLDEQSLENLFQSLRSNQLYKTYSNEEIIDAILRKKPTIQFLKTPNFVLDYHRDSTPKTRLLAFANQTDCSLIDKQRHHTNVDTYNSVDVDINELIIKPWCSRFCPRCYTYKSAFHSALNLISSM